MKRRFRNIMAALLVAVLAIVGNGAAVNAQAVDEFETTVNIHKIETDSAAKDMSADELANGIDNLAEWFGEGATGLKGVTFEVYSVDQTEFETMEATPASYTTADQVTTGGGTLHATTAATNENGLTTVALPEGYYWVIEVPQDTIASSTAVPFGLTLPYTNGEGTANLSTINVYPKNTLEDTPTPPVKTVESNTQYIGQEFNWTVTATVPAGIAEYTTYQFVDTIDSQLDYVSASLATPEGMIENTDYTLNFDATTGNLTLSFTETGIAKLVEESNIELVITTLINDTAVLGRAIENDVVLNFENPHTNGSTSVEILPTVVTGGRKFIKTEDTTAGAGLAGAEFVVRNSNGQFISQDADTLAITLVDNQSEATIFTSAADGTFEVNGLAFGSYTLIEVKAPTGFALPTNPETAFDINAESYYVDPAVEALVETAPTAIVNKAITIPQTGGPGTILFTIVGAGLMIMAVIYYRRANKEQEES